jgi:hypothetical protein
MQNKVRGINNEKSFLREKPSKLFSFFPKRKQATRTHQKKNDYSMRMSVCPSVLRSSHLPNEKRREKKGEKKFFA